MNRPGFAGGSNSRETGAMENRKTFPKYVPDVRGRAGLMHNADDMTQGRQPRHWNRGWPREKRECKPAVRETLRLGYVAKQRHPYRIHAATLAARHPRRRRKGPPPAILSGRGPDKLHSTQGELCCAAHGPCHRPARRKACTHCTPALTLSGRRALVAPAKRPGRAALPVYHQADSVESVSDDRSIMVAIESANTAPRMMATTVIV